MDGTEAKARRFGQLSQKPPSIDSWEKCGNDAVWLNAFIRSACDASMPLVPPGPKKRGVYWWTEEIGELHKNCNSARRIVHRRSRGGGDALVSGSWKKLCEQLEADPWGVLQDSHRESKTFHTICGRTGAGRHPSRCIGAVPDLKPVLGGHIFWCKKCKRFVS